MNDQDPALMKMKSLLAEWESKGDRRLVFLDCYQLMTQNILSAIEANDFEDTAWINRLMENFAQLYFQALDAFDNEQAGSPAAWQIAFKAAHQPHTHVLQNLVLGVNAHINYDLVFALADILAPEWQQLTAEQRKMRYHDHCHVNDIIYHTVDAVQNQVIDRYEPEFGLVDKVLGPIDEWMTSLLIADWREEVWEHAVQILDSTDNTQRQKILDHVEQTALERARDILGRGGLVDIFDFL